MKKRFSSTRGANQRTPCARARAQRALGVLHAPTQHTNLAPSRGINPNATQPISRPYRTLHAWQKTMGIRNGYRIVFIKAQACHFWRARLSAKEYVPRMSEPSRPARLVPCLRPMLPSQRADTQFNVRRSLGARVRSLCYAICTYSRNVQPAMLQVWPHFACALSAIVI
jgi:hypothetical protein